MKEGRRAFKNFNSKLTGKRPLGMPRRRWEDNIRMKRGRGVFKNFNR